MDRVVASFANERGNYLLGLDRLGESLSRQMGNPAAFDFRGFRGEASVGAPPHLENPYAFKIYCIDRVLSMGYRKVLWLDASVVAMAPLGGIWEVIERDGYIMQEAGHSVGRWCNDRTLEYFGLSREEAMGIFMYGNAGFLGLDLDNGVASRFYRLWKQSMLDGQFIGSWENHRHDMTCGSVIAHTLGMKYQSGSRWLHYAPIDQAPEAGVVFHASGM